MQTDDKPRLVRVTDPKEIEAVKAGYHGNIASPCGHYFMDDMGNIDWYADAAELAKWRAGRVNEV